MEVLNLVRLFWGWVFPYISRIHTAYIGEYLHFRYLKCLVIMGERVAINKCIQDETKDQSEPSQVLTNLWMNQIYPPEQTNSENRPTWMSQEVI